jgi:hypothetical protein
MKTLLELYIILLKFFETNNPNPKDVEYTSFICNNIDDLFENKIITKDEKELLYNHFKDERPSEIKHSDFYYNKLYNKSSTVWFQTNSYPELSFSLRVQILTNIITDLKNVNAHLENNSK